jgi:ABC-type Mn2+/Zn2+ transport system ATPase subunit
MVGEGRGKIVNKGREYKKIFVYIPKEVAADTSFPFKIGEHVKIKINGKKLVIEKLKEPPQDMRKQRQLR